MLVATNQNIYSPAIIARLDVPVTALPPPETAVVLRSVGTLRIILVGFHRNYSADTLTAV